MSTQALEVASYHEIDKQILSSTSHVNELVPDLST